MAVRTGRLRPAQHQALLYREPREYAATVSAFLNTGLADGERAFAIVPADRHDLLRAALGRAGADVEFADMTSLGGNPARIIPAIEEFASDGDRPARVVAEAAWPGRSAAELAEVARHEALVNLALAGTATHVLCPYDAAHLPSGVLADARGTHPQVSDGRRTPVPRTKGYRGPGRLPASCTAPLPSPPANARTVG